VALVRKDVALAMPPHALWFRGADAVARFFRTPRFSAFWSSLAAWFPHEQTAYLHSLSIGVD
jgi:hypothetical protein